MDETYAASTADLARRSVYSMLIPVSVACFVGTLMTDIAYWRSADMMWTNFSAWLLTAGLVTGGLALVAAMFDAVTHRRNVFHPPAWPHILGNIVALALALVNAFVHTRDAWTSVVPTGLALSAAVVIVLLVTALIGGWLLSRRSRVGGIR